MGNKVNIVEKIKGKKFRKEFTTFNQAYKFVEQYTGRNKPRTYDAAEAHYCIKEFNVLKKSVSIKVMVLNAEGEHIVGKGAFFPYLDVSPGRILRITREDLNTIKGLEKNL